MYQKLAERIHRDEDGFTLVELLVVIVILGILAAIVVFSVLGVKDKGKAAACSTDVNMLVTAEESYFAQTGNWATSQSTLVGQFIARESSSYDVAAPTAANPTHKYSIVLKAGSDCPAVPAELQ